LRFWDLRNKILVKLTRNFYICREIGRYWWMKQIVRRAQFHQRFTYSFYARRSRKRKKMLMTWLYFFTLSGSTSVKASHKTLVKLTLDYLKEKRECFCESLKVVNVVESRSNFHRLEKRHSKDCENEHDEKEKKGDVDKRRKSHDQWKEKGSNPLRTLD